MITLLVAVCGGLGAAARFVVDSWFRARAERRVPVGTVVINTVGAALIGVLAGALVSGALPVAAYTMAASGFCGGFTTFSTAMVETVRLIQAGDLRVGIAYAVGQLILAVTVVSVAFWIVVQLA